MSHQQHCYCSKCNGRLVSERTERAHRNGPAFRQVEAASRKPGRQKRRKIESTEEFEPSSGLDLPQSSDVNITLNQSDLATDREQDAVAFVGDDEHQRLEQDVTEVGYPLLVTNNLVYCCPT